ncbi:MAG: DRTGG domain-containing protein [Desulfobacterota bacterium]|nr:DRTGG domain-containing protein [Thermodesulfobacteriota bacterium]
MTLADVQRITNAVVLVGEDKLDLSVTTAFSADLMSDVLAFARPGCLLITGLTNAQSVRTAYALDIAAILVCRGKMPQPEAVEIARELHIPLLATPYIMFETSGRLFQNGMVGCIKDIPHRHHDIVGLGATASESFQVRGKHFDEAGRVSNNIKKRLREQGIPEEIVRRVAVIAFEAEVNIICYAVEGSIQYRITPSAITLQAIDRGPGIADIQLAMQEGYSTADDIIRSMGFGAGMGLSNMKKFSDEFDISSEVGKGTYVKSVIRLCQERGAQERRP